MKKLNIVGLVLASVLCACGLNACYVDSNCIDRVSTHCELECVDVCSPREVCEMRDVCDSWGRCVLDELCWMEDYCYTDCNDRCYDYVVCERPYECYEDRDCGVNAICRGGSCMLVDGNGGNMGGNGGNGGYMGVKACGNCQSASDCADYASGGACVALESGEQVCTRSCGSDNDCSSGFYCGQVENGNMTSMQCLPSNGSCDNSYCRDARDCVENAACEDHKCVLAKDRLSECETYKDCAGMQSSDGSTLNVCVKYSNDKQVANYCSIDCYSDRGCDAGYYCYLTKADLESGVCFRGQDMACRFDDDCTDNMICSNARCTLRCASDADCSSPSKKFTCDNGACTYHD